MGTDNLIFLEMIEWFDETGNELIHRIPEKGSGEIKFGAQLIVRESQLCSKFYFTGTFFRYSVYELTPCLIEPLDHFKKNKVISTHVLYPSHLV